jgi:acyl carrier protein
MNVETVFPKLQAIVADVLMIDEEDVSINSQLISELGAESIDFLDLVFQLEQEFDIKIPRGQLEKEARGALTEDEFSEKGVLTAQGMKNLRVYFAGTPEECFKTGLKVSEIPTLFTVETFCKLVVKETAKKEAVHLEESPA